jgi:hypothetical protein
MPVVCAHTSLVSQLIVTQHSVWRRDISSVVNDMGSQSSDRDFFVDLSPVAEYIYTMMISFRDQETIPVISISPSLAWLNIRLSYRIEGSIDPDTFEKGMHQIKLLAVRVEEVGGKLEIEREDIPVISHKILAEKVERTANDLRAMHSQSSI